MNTARPIPWNSFQAGDSVVVAYLLPQFALIGQLDLFVLVLNNVHVLKRLSEPAVPLD